MPATKKNVTLNLRTDLIQATKVLAAKRGRSMTALVEELLEEQVRSEHRVDDAVRELLAYVPKLRFRRKPLAREEIYER
jgi:hypothetical protein